MTLLAVGPQYGTKYTLTGPDGTVVVFNDSADANYVGQLTDISGFDSAEVRENADNLVQMDGGIHGDFFYGRRPITMTGQCYNNASAAERNLKMTRLMQATNAMRADASLQWTPDGGGPTTFVRLRRQAPLRITGGWNKEFQISMVAADPRIYSATLYNQSVLASAGGAAGGFGFNLGFNMNFGAASVTGQMTVTNNGNAESYPIYTITGGGVNPSIYNATTGKTLSFIYTLADGETLVVDTLNRTVYLNNVTSRYGALDFSTSSWGGLVPGDNDLRLIFYSYNAGASLRVDWRDAWL